MCENKIDNIEIVEGDLLDADVDIICHQVNCRGVMGAGLAKQIATMFPIVYNEYKNYYMMFKFKSNLLGECLIVNNEIAFKHKEYSYIANLFGQENCSTTDRMTDYEALYKSFDKLFEFANSLGNKETRIISIGIPYKIGAGLARGDWNIIFEIIKHFANEYKNRIKIKIYKYE